MKHYYRLIAAAAITTAILPIHESFAQDYIVNPEFIRIYENLYRFRTLYGDDFLTDISPERIFSLINDSLQNFKWRLLEIETSQKIDKSGGWEVAEKWRGRQEQ